VPIQGLFKHTKIRFFRLFSYWFKRLISALYFFLKYFGFIPGKQKSDADSDPVPTNALNKTRDKNS